MKFSSLFAPTSAAMLFAISNLVTASAASEAGQCISGKGEFAFRGAVDAHFTLDACQEDSTTHVASGYLQSGQFNADGDVFHYNVHCMATDGPIIYVGAEIEGLSNYVATYQDPEALHKALVNGDLYHVLAFERKVHQTFADEPKYINALTAHLEAKGETVESYEEAIGHNDKKDGGKHRQLSSSSSSSSSEDAKEIPLQVLECVGNWIEGTPSCDPQNYDGIADFEFSEGASDELKDICFFTSIFLCCYTSDYHGGNIRDCGTRRLLVEKDETADTQGTFALFQLSLDGDHSIAVKIGHDFDTTCADFAETIDHGFFTDETVDHLTIGEFSIN